MRPIFAIGVACAIGMAGALLGGCSATQNAVAPSPDKAESPTAITGFVSPQVLAASADGSTLYVTQNDGSVVRIATPGYGQLGRWDSGVTVPLGIALSPDGQTLYLSNRTASSVVLKDPTTGAAKGSWSTGSGSNPTGIGLAPDGATIYVPQNASAGLGADKLTVRSAATGALAQTWTFAKGSRPRSVVISPDGTRAFVAMEGAQRIAVLNTVDGSQIASWDLADSGARTPGYQALSKNGDRLYVVMASPSAVLVIDTKSGQVLQKWTDDLSSAFGVAAATCGQTVFVSDWLASGTVEAFSQPNQCGQVPSAPQNVKAVFNSKTKSVKVTWSAPTDAGSSPITSYTATGVDNNKKTDHYDCTTANGTTLTCTFVVTNAGPNLDVTVVATNAAGAGPASSPPIDVRTK